MNGPSAFVTQHLLDRPLNFEFGAFLYPFVAVGLYGFSWFVEHYNRDPRVWPWPLFATVAFAGWAGLSAFWSVAPTLTSVRALVTTGVLAFGARFALELRFREQLMALASACAIAGAASIGVLAIHRPWGVDQIDGFWIGIFTNRNSLAPVCSLGLVTAAFVIVEFPSRGVRAMTALAGVGWVVLMKGAESSSALLAGLVAGGTALIIGPLRALRRRGCPGSLVVASGLAAVGTAWFVVFSNFSIVTRLTGKTLTLSGRRLIWPEIRKAIRVHPIRGWGYWSVWDAPEFYEPVFAATGQRVATAHNSLLEVALGLGVIGAACYLTMALAALRAYSWAWRSTSRPAVFWSAIAAFVLAENLTESFVLWYSYNLVLFVACGLAVFGPAGDRDVRSVDHGRRSR